MPSLTVWLLTCSSGRYRLNPHLFHDHFLTCFTSESRSLSLFTHEVSTGGRKTISIVPGQASPVPLPINMSEFFSAIGAIGDAGLRGHVKRAFLERQHLAGFGARALGTNTK